MNYEVIEELVLRAKAKDKKAIYDLITEFIPLIKKLCRRTYISNYGYEDLKQECIVSLLKSIEMYKIENHRFVAYATNAIKNNLNYLIRKNIIKNKVNGQGALTPTGSLEELHVSINDESDKNLIKNEYNTTLKKAIGKLDKEQKELFIYVQLKKNKLKDYAELKNISYSTAGKRRKEVLKLLNIYMKKET